MSILGDLFPKWKERRDREAAERARLEVEFNAFLSETEPLVPVARKHPQAALYRHAWKRASVLHIICQRIPDPERASLYARLGELAAERYYRVAPDGPYGKATLRLEPKATMRLLQEEIQRLVPPQPTPQQALACIYAGACERGLVYVGQTTDAPERRWMQHRLAQTGPFKKGATYVQWRVIHGPVPELQLDELESYYIGLFDAVEAGYNEGRGNAWQAYERGCSDRRSGKPRP